MHIVESHLRLNHPELCEVARSVGVLGTESRSEGVDFTQGHCSQFTLQLTAHRETGPLAEEILRIVNCAFCSAWKFVQVQGGHLKHLACTLAVGSSDKRSVEIDKTLVVEIVVNGKCHSVTDSEHRSEGIGPRTQVGNLPEILQRVALLLKGIHLRVSLSIHLNFRSLNLHSLSASH